MTTLKKGPWTILSKSDVYDNPWIRLTHHEVLTPAGTPGVYGQVHFKNIALAIVPVDAEGHTYLVGQYRFPRAAGRSTSIRSTRRPASCARRPGWQRGTGGRSWRPTCPTRCPTSAPSSISPGA